MSRISLPSYPSLPNHTENIIQTPFRCNLNKALDPISSPPHYSSPPATRATARSRPSSCDAYSQYRQHSASPSRQASERHQPFSTIRRTHSPFRSITIDEHSCTVDTQHKITIRPPLPSKCQPTGRPPLPPACCSSDKKLNAEDDGTWEVLRVEEQPTQPIRTPPVKEDFCLPDFTLDQQDMSR